MEGGREMHTGPFFFRFQNDEYTVHADCRTGHSKGPCHYCGKTALGKTETTVDEILKDSCVDIPLKSDEGEKVIAFFLSILAEVDERDYCVDCMIRHSVETEKALSDADVCY